MPLLVNFQIGKMTHKIGDKLVGLAGVMRISEIVSEEDAQAKLTKYYVLKPAFKIKDDSAPVTVQVPVQNITMAKFRDPLTRKEIRDLLDSLAIKKRVVKSITVIDIQENYQLNDPAMLVELLRELIREQLSGKELTFSKKKIYDQAVRLLAEELAVVYKLKLPQAEAKIIRIIEKLLK